LYSIKHCKDTFFFIVVPKTQPFLKYFSKTADFF